MSLMLNHTNEIVNLGFNEKFWNEVKRTQISLDEDKPPTGEEDSSVKSIDELIWKPITVNRKKLLSYYMNLSKPRLTGRFSIV